MIEMLFENSPNGYFAFDDDATTLVVNDTLVTILEKSKQEIVGQSVETFFTLPTRIFFQTHLLPIIRMHGFAEEIFITLLTSTGNHLPVLLNAKKMQWEGKFITTCSCIMVPNRKKFEDELVAARKTAEKALQENTALLKAKAELQKQTEELDIQMQLVRRQNRELQQFNHVVTHNLKEPLRKIFMYSGMLSNETDAPSLKKLLKANEQMKAVVSGLQQYVWLNEKTTDFTPVDLNELVINVLMQIKQEFADVQLSVTQNQLPIIEGDRDQLSLLFYHLLSNAAKFRKGASAYMTIEGIRMKQNRFRAIENQYEYEDFIRIEIVDEGIGFEPMYAGHIFDLFRKLHYSEGRGLGLALCKKIVENHNGQIEAESEVNKFTKLTLWLPSSN